MDTDKPKRSDEKVGEGPQPPYHPLKLEVLSTDDATLIRRAYSILANNDAAADSLQMRIRAGLSGPTSESETVTDNNTNRAHLPDLTEFRKSIKSDGTQSESLYSERDESRF